MAVGETSGQSKPRQVVSSPSAPRKPEPTEEAVEQVEQQPLVPKADAEFEKLLAEEEAIEASLRDKDETPNFRPGDAD